MEIEIGRLKGLPASSSYSAITLAFANIIIMEWNSLNHWSCLAAPLFDVNNCPKSISSSLVCIVNIITC